MGTHNNTIKYRMALRVCLSADELSINNTDNMEGTTLRHYALTSRYTAYINFITILERRSLYIAHRFFDHVNKLA
jgi:hypothetical protein